MKNENDFVAGPKHDPMQEKPIIDRFTQIGAAIIGGENGIQWPVVKNRKDNYGFCCCHHHDH
jgi:hypothetical protein